VQWRQIAIFPIRANLTASSVYLRHDLMFALRELRLLRATQCLQSPLKLLRYSAIRTGSGGRTTTCRSIGESRELKANMALAENMADLVDVRLSSRSRALLIVPHLKASKVWEDNKAHNYYGQLAAFISESCLCLESSVYHSM
jgi:hypothetical protein